MPDRRPHVPLRVQRDAALLQLGLDPATAELDHDPALGLRLRTDDGGYIPEANDPRYLTWRDADEHRRKTSGTKASSAGSDIHRIAKVKRLARANEEAQRRLLAKPRGEANRAYSRWPKGRKIRSRNTLRRDTCRK